MECACIISQQQLAYKKLAALQAAFHDRGQMAGGMGGSCSCPACYWGKMAAGVREVLVSCVLLFGARCVENDLP
eukprot:scaffold75728_cov22-Tisochrysis_lutea.AAC.2